MKLNNEKIKALKPKENGKNFKKYDGNNLFLLVTSHGSKLWRFKYKFGGKYKEMALGKYPTIPLKLARTKADKARQLLSDSIDPMAQRKLLKLQSTCKDLNFGEIALQWFELNKKEKNGAMPTKKNYCVGLKAILRGFVNYRLTILLRITLLIS